MLGVQILVELILILMEEMLRYRMINSQVMCEVKIMVELIYSLIVRVLIIPVVEIYLVMLEVIILVELILTM
jgi:hypothetical protein